MDNVLRVDFGFNNILWVYSGRRGVHCWVADKRAKVLDSEGRGAIVSYLSVITGGSNKQIKVNLPHTLPPSLKRLYDDILLPEFESNIIIGQKLFDTQENWEKVLTYLPPGCEAASNLREKWTSKKYVPDPLNMWQEFENTVKNEIQNNMQRYFKTNPIYNVVFTYTYPRLDTNVSKGINHLLKCPFVVHPSTGKICVPISPLHCDDFNPDDVPTLEGLIGELDSTTPAAQKIESNGKGWVNTSLREYVKLYDRFFLQPLLRQVRATDTKTDF